MPAHTNICCILTVCVCVCRFDEVYYGQFLSLYMKRIFFIEDSGPPLGHMILALGGEFTQEPYNQDENAVK